MRHKPREFCIKCLKAKSTCFCQHLSPKILPFELIILMHPKERRHRSGTGTGRLTHLCISNSNLIEGVHFSENIEVQKYLNSNSYLPCVLFPSEKSFDLNSLAHATQFKNLLLNKTLAVFVIDGSWSCAKAILKANPFLNDIPKISFSHFQKSQYEFKKQPQENCLSTLESVVLLLKHLENSEIVAMKSVSAQTHLMEMFHRLVRIQVDYGVPSKI
jgi:DTW domain-containing protein